MNNIPTIWIQKRDGEYFCHCPFCHYEHYSGLERSPPVIKAKTPEGYLKKCATTGNEYIIRIGEPERGTVWVDERPSEPQNNKSYRVGCPNCKEILAIIAHTSNADKWAKDSGYRRKCDCCHTKYLIRIRPSTEQFKAGDRLQSVQWWKHSKANIWEVEVILVDGKLIFQCDDGQTSVDDALNYDKKTSGYCQHYSLHTTYEDALRTAAPLWEADKTELWIAFRSGSELMYKVFEAKFEKGSCLFRNSAAEKWRCAPLKELDKGSHCQSATTRLYLGPDRDAAERICREKNGEGEESKVENITLQSILNPANFAPGGGVLSGPIADCLNAIKLLALEIQGIKDELRGEAERLPQIWVKELPGDEKRFYTCPRCNNKGEQYLGNVTESTIKRDGYEVSCGQCGRNYVIHFHPPGEQTIEYCQNPDNWSDSFKKFHLLYHEAQMDKKLDEVEKDIEELEAKLKNNP